MISDAEGTDRVTDFDSILLAGFSGQVIRQISLEPLQRWLPSENDIP